MKNRELIKKEEFMKLYYGAAMSSLLLCSALQASLVAITDGTSVNKFLGAAIPACSASSHGCNKGDVTTSSMYVDQRQTLDGLLGINFSKYKDRVIYLFNEFGYWSAQREQFMNKVGSSSVYNPANATSNDLGLAEVDQAGLLNQQMQSKYPGAGVYTIAISAVPAFVDRVGKNVPCQTGQIKIAAILLYDNGVGLQPLSASCIAVRPSDTFSLQISSNNPGAVSLPAEATAFSGVLTSSPSGSVNFQAKQITVTIPPALADTTSTDSTSTSGSKKTSSSSASKTTDSSTDSSTPTPAADIVPAISLGAPLNLGSSPQSIMLKKGS